MLGDSQGIYALILTDLPWWSFCNEALKKNKPTFLRNCRNQLRKYWNNLTTLPCKCFQKGSWRGKTEKNNIYRLIQVSDPLHTIWPMQRLQRQQEKHPKHIRKELSGSGGQASLQVPIPAMPRQPWSCCPWAQPQTEALAWQKEWGKRGTAKRNLNVCLCKFLLLLWRVLVSKGDQQ